MILILILKLSSSQAGVGTRDGPAAELPPELPSPATYKSRQNSIFDLLAFVDISTACFNSFACNLLPSITLNFIFPQMQLFLGEKAPLTTPPRLDLAILSSSEDSLMLQNKLC
jgi:hypothetical protein